MATIQVGCFGGVHLTASEAAKNLATGNHDLYTQPQQLAVTEVAKHEAIFAYDAWAVEHGWPVCSNVGMRAALTATLPHLARKETT